MCIAVPFAEAKQPVGIMVVMVLIHKPVERDAAFEAWELIVFYQQDVLLHRVEGEFLYVDSKGKEVSEIVDV